MLAFARRRLTVIGVWALVAFSSAFAEAAFVHTDDGCKVEVHCLACRWTVGTTGTAPPPVFALVAGLVRAGTTPELPARATPETTLEVPAARGPPPLAR
jgi:hypothetical protein